MLPDIMIPVSDVGLTLLISAMKMVNVSILFYIKHNNIKSIEM